MTVQALAYLVSLALGTEAIILDRLNLRKLTNGLRM